MKIYGINEDLLRTNKAIFTASEINQQPSTWLKTFKQIASMQANLKAYISKITTQDDFDIILTGAGTSEFVGNALYPYLNTLFNNKVKSFATTDITQSPEYYLTKDKPTLLISFARSGNSPESVASVDIATAYNPNLINLFITCNKDGALAKLANENPRCYSIELTEETNDNSFAMTSSFSNMYLAAILAFNLDNLTELEAVVTDIANSTKKLNDTGYVTLKNMVSEFNFNRIVYLGANTLKGTSQESALKMLELTAGQCVSMYDTPMGFRHGPKSIINDETLTTIYVENNPYSRQYTKDIIIEMSKQRKGNKILAITTQQDDEIANLVDYYYNFANQEKYANVYLGLEYIESS